MKSNPNFDYLHQKINEQRIILLQGGTRSGKTFATIYFIIDYCMLYSGMEIDIVRDTFTALKATAWKDFKDVLMTCNLYDELKHNKTDHTYTLNGNTISYYGADTPDKIHGRSRDILWVNEAHQFPAETIDQLFPRTRHKIICDYNPALGLEHWLDQYIEKYPPLITTYKDNPYLTAAQVEDIESRKHNDYWWKIYGSGERATREGAIFTNWSVGEFDTSLPYCYGQDYGFSIDPTTLIKVSINEKTKTIFADELLYSNQSMGTESILTANKELINKPHDLIIADNAEPRLIDDLKRKGLNILPCEKGQGSVTAGITKMQDYKIIITERSHNLRKELSNYVWNDKRAGIPIDAFNHCFIGETLISTPNGQKRIDEIKVGDYVMTRKGAKKVLKVFNNGEKQVEKYLIETDTFSVSLVSTNNHLINTNNGWTQISKLRLGQMVCLYNNSTVNNILYTQKKDISQGAAKECTLRFGNIIMVNRLKDIIYTIRMAIRGIIILKTLSKYRLTNIYLSMVSKGLKITLNGLKIFNQKVLQKHLSGINQRMVENGIVNMQNYLIQIEKKLNILANNVVIHTGQNTQEGQNTATIIAKLKHLEKGESYKALVYDIMVEDEHEYFANGILVHNCVDALRYAFTYLTRPKYSTVIKKSSLI